MTPTERLLTILRLINEAQDRGAVVAAATRVREQMAGIYEGTAGARMWRRDIRTLRDRGLIETDLSTRMTPNRTGIRLRVPAKPERLHLTGREHAAISRARRALRGTISSVSPLRPRESPRHGIDDASRILRFLEENDEEVELGQLSSWLNLPQRDVYELIDALTREDVINRGVVTSIEFGYDVDETADLPTTVRVFRGSVRCQSPTRGCGMDELGFFPYSLPETEDRLSLIDEALSKLALEGPERQLLSQARAKLTEWRVNLMAAMS
ncbi:hypothetical protein FOS14_11095 [Skermania sp. ID1734]|uniref:hypothetical protein n=1 Tax=Skermania sp. ID1734 TaxID=2597516 RepID=UPI00117D15CC|nr:hypothetical protein [Skermania sp. ID1734]TSD99787.1 hypothetical protein FOS14_11095 [Skermania sp. ID1734]